MPNQRSHLRLLTAGLRHDPALFGLRVLASEWLGPTKLETMDSFLARISATSHRPLCPGTNTPSRESGESMELLTLLIHSTIANFAFLFFYGKKNKVYFYFPLISYLQNVNHSRFSIFYISATFSPFLGPFLVSFC